MFMCGFGSWGILQLIQLATTGFLVPLQFKGMFNNEVKTDSTMLIV